ncbi:hypothetical protein TVAG_396190 [Trichomonas vaginalis G3]|uniref:Uncharacterized protein n=1 Tax=Trichomonas vaginalis (strain ATCC PRA-98 / G3) TaxID=412133 RepID=A2ESD0_TRIV3|nr:spectrin binding [Trichomonas vaginalis G3]EAY04433.1 hypothetical protein TVAG_396190 [Trichomonas vaginalis G3]KAI5502205.1 spectrin binding [Trichomonas vaginalis G3]|eukprot:XP_001316656.1 hypothetical protein [Trichomonas vaginalis G3]
MSENIILDTDYIANNIQIYIDEGNFIDIFDVNTISEVLSKTEPISTNFRLLISQFKENCNSLKLCACVQKSNINILSFEDAINVLQSYNQALKLNSLPTVIRYLEEYGKNTSRNQNNLISENQKLQNKISNLEKEINESNNNFFAELRMLYSEKYLNSDFGAIYDFLKQASDNGDKMKMSISCEIGLDKKKDSGENTPLLSACSKGDLQLVKSLIEKGCDRDAINKDECNCLIIASYNGHLEIVKYLIGIGFDKNCQYKLNGSKAIHFASQNGHLEVVKYLISIGANPKEKDNDGWSPIHAASQNGHLEVVKYLISIGADTKEKDNDGVTPIHAASQNGHLEVVKYLSSIGANPKEKNNNGWSPIHFAAKKGQFDVVEYLVSINVNLNDKNAQGKTPLDLAKEKQNENENYKKITNLLRNRG